MTASPSRSLSFLLAFTAATTALTVGCGGRSADFGGEGSSSGSGSSSGASSSGGSSGGSSSGISGSSSGISGSSSGISGSSSGISGSSSGISSSGGSSGGAVCPVSPPQGECFYDGELCSYADSECGSSCQCEGGEWSCFENPCAPPPPPICPPIAPTNGGECAGSEDGLLCDYSNGSTCNGEQCSCAGGTWSCAILDCPPPPVCPTFPPTASTSCDQIGSSCSYYVNGDCNQESCVCDSLGSWTCNYSVGCGDDAGGITLPP